MLESGRLKQQQGMLDDLFVEKMGFPAIGAPVVRGKLVNEMVKGDLDVVTKRSKLDPGAR